MEKNLLNRRAFLGTAGVFASTPYWWKSSFMDIDLNVLAGPDFAALFAIDLKYKVSESNQFVSSGKRSETMAFKVPAYLSQCNAAVKVTHEGISEVNVKISNETVIITDTFETTGTSNSRWMLGLYAGVPYGMVQLGPTTRNRAGWPVTIIQS